MFVQVQIHVKGRGDDGGTQIAAVLAALKESSGPTPTVGWLPKEKPEGDLMTRWARAESSPGATAPWRGAMLSSNVQGRTGAAILCRLVFLPLSMDCRRVAQ